MSLILDLIFPKICYGCRRVGSYFCPTCISGLKFRAVKHDPGYIGFEGILSLFRYRSFIRTAIKDLKFNFVSDLSSELVSIMVDGIKYHYPHLLSYWQENHFILTSVPLHPKRYHWRGFNQSALIGSQVALGLGLEFSDSILSRVRDTMPQTTINNKTDRSRNLQNSFGLNRSCLFPLPNLIIFDDVVTTGSTLKSAASALPANIKIWGLTIAG